MKKRILSMLLALTMVLSLCPTFTVTASAANVIEVSNGLQTAITDAPSGSTIKLTADITENITIPAKKEITLDLNGKVLNGSNAPTPVALGNDASVIHNKGNLTIKDSSTGVTHKFRVGSNGLWTLDEQNGTATVTGGVITGGKGLIYESTNTYGGGVFNDGTLKLESGNIVGNNTVVGGGVRNEKNCSFIMTGGSIKGNRGTSYGGGVSNVGNFTMTGGEISNNRGVTGGGVYNKTGSTMTVGGAVTIKDNMMTSTEVANNVYLKDGVTITVSPALATTARIGVTLENGTGNITKSANANYSGNFTSDNTSYSVSNSGTADKQRVYIGEYVAVNIDTGKLYSCVSAAINDVPNGTETSPSSATIQMLKDSSENVEIKQFRNITFDLNGCVLNLNGKSNVVSGKLKITDSNNAATHAGDYATLPAGGVIYNGNANWDDNPVKGSGGAFVVIVASAEKPVLTMEAGTVYKCTATDGSAVFVAENAKFIMNGGVIDSCTAENSGGAVRTYKGTVEISGTIKNCTAKVFGGGIYNDRGTVTIKTGAVIDNCSVSGGTSGDLLGGGIFNDGNLYMEGGTIKNCTAQKGAGVHNNGKIEGTSFTMTGGSITGNKASRESGKSTGAGVQVSENSGFTMTGGSITGNVLAAPEMYGAGVYCKGTITLGGTAKISGNTYKKDEETTVTSNLHLYTDKTVAVSTTTALAIGASIGVTTETAPTKGNPIAITGSNGANYSGYFTADDSTNYKIYNTGSGTAQIVKSSVHEHTWNYGVGTTTSTNDTLKAWCSESFGTGYCDNNTENNAQTVTIQKPASLTYDGNAKSATLSATSLGGLTLDASNITYEYKATADGSYAPTTDLKNAGFYKATITVDTNKTAYVEYTIAKATPEITAVPKATAITYGQTLADSTLTDGAATVEGIFAWEDSTKVPKVFDSEKTEYVVVFTPNDTDNYNTVKCKVTLTVKVRLIKVSTLSTKFAVTDTVIFTAETANRPYGSYVVWTTEGASNNFSGVSGSTDQVAVQFTAEGDVTVTAKLMSKDGQVLAADSQTVTVTKGPNFIVRMARAIGSFFSNLFH